MDKNMEKTIEDIRMKYNVPEEENTDGGEGSGNWGHVGRPGEWGGSMPGGGNAFRLTDTSKGKGAKGIYSSQAKLRKAMQDRIAEAKKNAGAAKLKMLQAASKRLNMAQKSIHKIKNYNENASRDILKDKNGKGKMTASPTNKNMMGTAEGIQETYIKNTNLAKKKK